MTDNIESPRPAAVAYILEATTGGTRRHLMDLVAGLNHDRFSIRVICSTRRGDPAFLREVEDMRSRGVRVADIPMTREIHPFSDLSAFFAIYGNLKRNRPDIVHTHSSKAGFLGRCAARLAGVPVVIHTPHVFPFQMEVSRWRQAFYVRLERFAAGLADKIICIYPGQREAAITAGLSVPEKFVVIENGICLSGDMGGGSGAAVTLRRELGIGEECPLAGSAGRLTRQKGYEHFVRAAAIVVSRMPNARFVIVGDGEERARLERLVDQLSLRGKFFFLASQAELSGFHSTVDVFVLSSLWEGLPYALLDAMARGKAVVATRTGGMVDYISPGQTGILVPPKDPNALAEAIVDLLARPDLRATLGQNARDLVRKRGNLGEMIGRVEALYEAALDSAARKR